MVHRLKQFRNFVRTMIITTLIILVLLGVCQYAPLTSGNDLQVLAQVSSQQWAVQRIAKDAMLMQSGSAFQRIQAVNELQTTLPEWETTQRSIQGSALSVDVQVLFASTATDYTAIDTATKAILAHPDQAADPTQVRIITDHTDPYFTTTSQIAAITQQRMLVRTQWLFGIEIALSAIVFGLELWRLFAIERLVRDLTKNGKDRLDERV